MAAICPNKVDVHAIRYLGAALILLNMFSSLLNIIVFVMLKNRKATFLSEGGHFKFFYCHLNY